MRIYNRSERAFIIDRDDAIDGCRFPTDEVGKLKAYIDPGTEAEVRKEVAEKMINDYPKEIMSLEKKNTATVRLKPRKEVLKPVLKRTAARKSSAKKKR